MSERALYAYTNSNETFIGDVDKERLAVMADQFEPDNEALAHTLVHRYNVHSQLVEALKAFVHDAEHSGVNVGDHINKFKAALRAACLDRQAKTVDSQSPGTSAEMG